MDESTTGRETPRAQDTVLQLINSGDLPRVAICSLDFPDGETDYGIPRRAEMLSPERAGRAFHRWLLEKWIPQFASKCSLPAEAGNRYFLGTGLAALNACELAFRGSSFFAGYGLLSTSFEDISMNVPARAALLLALEDGAAPHSGTRLFFDYGTGGLDECYEPYHRELSILLRDRTAKSGAAFAVNRVMGGTHDADSWRHRLAAALRFLFLKPA